MERHLKLLGLRCPDDQGSPGFTCDTMQDYMGVLALKDKGMTVIDARAKADLLNKQFESVFTKEEDLDATMLFPHGFAYQK